MARKEISNADLVMLLSGYSNRPVIFTMKNDIGYHEYYRVTRVIEVSMVDVPVLQLEYKSVDVDEIVGAPGQGAPERG